LEKRFDEIGNSKTEQKAEFSKQVLSQMDKKEREFYTDLLNKAPDEIKSVWQKFGDKVKLINEDSTKGSAGATSGANVTMNLRKDINSKFYTKGNTFFHEFAHAFDNARTKGFGVNESMTANFKLSNGKKFGENIYDEVQQIIKNTAKSNGVSQKEAKFLLYEKLNEETAESFSNMASVVDLFGGATNRVVSVKNVGHDAGYWKPKKSRNITLTKEKNEEFRNNLLGMEGFAEFMAAHTMDKNELETMKRWLPESYKYYLELLKHLSN